MQLMHEKVRGSFAKYLQLVSSALHATPVAQGNKIVHLHESSKLQGLVENLEATEEFRALGTNARHAFDAAPSQMQAENQWAALAEEIHLGEWQQAVGNFFRRSGAYLDVFAGKTLDSEGLYRRFSDVCQRATTQVTHLALIDGVFFSEPVMDFGEFQIRNFTADGR